MADNNSGSDGKLVFTAYIDRFEASPDAQEDLKKLGGFVSAAAPTAAADALGGSDDSSEAEQARRRDEKRKYDRDETSAGEAAKSAKSNTKAAKSADEAHKKKMLTAMGQVSRATNLLSTTGLGVVQKSFGLIQEIYGRLKAASPLLQAIETLFNLAMTLFFMPLGNKLATMLIPSVTDLLSKVTMMWESLEGKTLGEMFEFAFDYGAKVFGEYFKNIGSQLSGQGDVLGAIGRVLKELGSFIKGHGVKLLETVLGIVGSIMRHLKLILSAIIAFKVMSVALQLAQIAVTASLTPWSTIAGAGITFASITGLAYGGLSSVGMASGGYVPSTPGGSVHILGEGGEGEYVIPESKMRSGAIGGTTNNYYINGYTDSELEGIIRRTTNDMVSRSRLQGTFRWIARERVWDWRRATWRYTARSKDRTRRGSTSRLSSRSPTRTRRTSPRSTRWSSASTTGSLWTSACRGTSPSG